VISSKCVTERIGTNAYTDVAPTGTSSYVGKGFFGTDTDTSCGVGQLHHDEINSIYPLTDDKDTLKRRIDKLTTVGRPPGHLGTAWAGICCRPTGTRSSRRPSPAPKRGGPTAT
jgi:hypothetical protein